MKEAAKKSNIKQVSAAAQRGTLFCSSQLQRGKNRVAKTAAMDNGTRNLFAKYNPATRRKSKSNFLIIAVDVALVIHGAFQNLLRQGNDHRYTQADAYSGRVSSLSKYARLF